MADEVDVGDIYKRISDQEAATGRLDEKLDGLVSTFAGFQTSLDRIASGSQVPYIPLIMIVLAIVVPGALAFNELETQRSEIMQIQIDTRKQAAAYQQDIIVLLSGKHQAEEVETAYHRGKTEETLRWMEKIQHLNAVERLEEP